MCNEKEQSDISFMCFTNRQERSNHETNKLIFRTSNYSPKQLLGRRLVGGGENFSGNPKAYVRGLSEDCKCCDLFDNVPAYFSYLYTSIYVRLIHIEKCTNRLIYSTTLMNVESYLVFSLECL